MQGRKIEGWRLCSPHVITDDSGSEFVLLQNQTTGVVCAYNGQPYFTALPTLSSEELGQYVDDGAIIKAARVRKGLTQEQLARIIGVTKAAVARWEVCERQATTKQRKALNEELDIKLAKYRRK